MIKLMKAIIFHAWSRVLLNHMVYCARALNHIKYEANPFKLKSFDLNNIEIIKSNSNKNKPIR